MSIPINVVKSVCAAAIVVVVFAAWSSAVAAGGPAPGAEPAPGGGSSATGLVFTPDAASLPFECGSTLEPLALPTRRVGTVSGALPGETITFTRIAPTPEIDYVPGSADADGRRDFWYACFVGSGNQTVTITARGNITGRTVTFTFTRTDPAPAPPAVAGPEPPEQGNGQPVPPPPLIFVANPELDPGILCDGFYEYELGGLIGAFPGEEFEFETDPEPPTPPAGDPADEDGASSVYLRCDPEFGGGEITIRARGRTSGRVVEFSVVTYKSLGFKAPPENPSLESPIRCDGELRELGDVYNALPGETLVVTEFMPGRPAQTYTLKAGPRGIVYLGLRCRGLVGDAMIRIRGETSGREVDIWFTVEDGIGPQIVEVQIPGGPVAAP